MYFSCVDKETCIACGVCGATAPNVFDYDDEGLAYCKYGNNQMLEQIPLAEVEDVMEAEMSCPTESIKVRQFSK
ncbi:ferredoxin [Gracilibacillus marinus]|jgi:ferredoxin|uniref:Ferredoxin n=1 Tax=Gracilibacillus marinus TaxID=630535 RepID=A0ABV8VUL4_9BACI